MVSRNTIVITVLIFLLLPVLFSGCIEEKNVAPAPDSIQKEAVDVSSQNLTQSSKEENIPLMEMVYALRVFPEKNITMFPVTTQEFSTSLLVMDDTGEEMINTSRITGVAVLRNQTYTLFEPRWKLIMPQMNFSNAYVVRISFSGYSYASGRLSINNQDIILDDKLNIIVVRNYPVHFNVD